MKDKIIARLKEKFPGINLSKARLDAIADKMKITAETEIDAKLDELNEIFPFADLARQDDRIRNLDNNPTPKPTDPPAPDKPAPAPAPVPNDAPEWAKAFMQTITTKVDSVVSDVTAIKTGKATDTRKSQLEAALKDAPEAFKNRILKDFARIPFDKDEDFNTYLEDVKADLPAVIQTEANAGLSRFPRPAQTKGDASKTASKEELDAVMSNIM